MSAHSDTDKTCTKLSITPRVIDTRKADSFSPKFVLTATTQLIYRFQFALRVALLIILPACLFSTNYGRAVDESLSFRFFSKFPSLFSYYAVVASAAFLTIREKGCLESIRFLFIVLQGWTLVVVSTLVYTAIIGLAPYQHDGSPTLQNIQVNVPIAAIRTDCSSILHFFNSAHFWAVYFTLIAFILCYILRDERNLRLSLVVFTVTMMSIYKENERMNCLSTVGCSVANTGTHCSSISLLGIKAIETHKECKLHVLLAFATCLLLEFLCGIVLGAVATLVPFPLIHPYHSIRSILDDLKRLTVNPRIMCIFNRWAIYRQHHEAAAYTPREVPCPVGRPRWLRVADSIKVALSLSGSILLYVYLYGNNGWNLPGPAILCFVAVFCDSHIERFAKPAQVHQLLRTEEAQRGPSIEPSLNIRALQYEVLSSLIFGGVHRLIGTLAAALLGYATFHVSSNAVFCFGSLIFCIFMFSFLRSYHIELFPYNPEDSKSRLPCVLNYCTTIISRARHATGVACFYGCFFLVGIIHPSVSSQEISVRIVKNFIAVAVYWTISLLYSLCFLRWKGALNITLSRL